MEPSYPWVMSVPTDSNRISMTFEIKDQEGQKIEEKTEKSSSDSGDSGETSEEDKQE